MLRSNEFVTTGYNVFDAFMELNRELMDVVIIMVKEHPANVSPEEFNQDFAWKILTHYAESRGLRITWPTFLTMLSVCFWAKQTGYRV